MNAPATPPDAHRMDRRSAIKWMMTAAASSALLDRNVLGADAVQAAKAGSAPGVGYGTDPNLIKGYKPGDVWSLTFSEAQRTTAAAVCDVIIPADEQGPSASSVGVPDFIDEWISAPYPGHEDDKRVVLAGLAWIDTEAQKRFNRGFAKLDAGQATAICDHICFLPDAKPEFRTGAQFFRLYRNLTAGGYYTTPEGMKDIGYTGNVALAKYDGPPREVLQKLGLA